MNTLKSLEGILSTEEGISKLLVIETGKTYDVCHKNLMNYVHQQQKEHPQREKVNLMRMYLSDELKKYCKQTE